jgi:hypothetical protein
MRGKQDFAKGERVDELVQTLLSKGERNFRVPCFKKNIHRQMPWYLFVLDNGERQGERSGRQSRNMNMTLRRLKLGFHLRKLTFHQSLVDDRDD